jgi:hypothetical protein
MPSGEWTDGAFPVLDPRGFYSTSGACSVCPFTTMVLGEGSARRQPEVRFDSEGLRSRQKRMGKAASRSLAGGRRRGARGSANESQGSLPGGREVNEPQWLTLRFFAAPVRSDSRWWRERRYRAGPATAAPNLAAYSATCSAAGLPLSKIRISM